MIKCTLEEYASTKGLTPAQRGRLISFDKQLSSDRYGRVTDSESIQCLETYVRNPMFLQDILNYLENLRDPDGNLFCQSLKRTIQLDKTISKFESGYVVPFIWNKHYQAAKLKLEKMLSSLHLIPLIYTDDTTVMEALPRRDTHSGYQYVETGKKYKGEYEEGIFDWYTQEEVKAKRNGSFDQLILPGVRTQASGAFEEEDGSKTNTCKMKTRLINMIALIVILGELKYAKPAQKALANFSFYAGGKDPTQISALFSDWRRRYRYFLSIDYSGFDQTVQRWLIEQAFDILKLAFAYVDEPLWDCIVHDFVYKDLVFKGNIIHLDKGVPSGSMFTQIIDSICNWLVIQTYLNSIGVNDSEMMIMGDDNIIFTNQFIDNSDLSAYVEKNFGMIIGDKSDKIKKTSEPPHFLSSFWKYDGRWRAPEVLISKLMYPETERKYTKKEDDGKPLPDEVVYGYICSYPKGMEQLMDIRRFMEDHQNYSRAMFEKRVKSAKYLPGSIMYNVLYTK